VEGGGWRAGDSVADRAGSQGGKEPKEPGGTRAARGALTGKYEDAAVIGAFAAAVPNWASKRDEPGRLGAGRARSVAQRATVNQRGEATPVAWLFACLPACLLACLPAWLGKYEVRLTVTRWV
jgi:hypothetical protein